MPKGHSGIKRGGKQSGGTQAVAIPQAKTIAEANALAVSLGLAKNANFTGIDVSAANDILQSIAEHKRDFPELPQLEFIGTVADFNRYATPKYGFRIKMSRGAAAAAFDGDKQSGCGPAIFFNKKVLSPKVIKTTRENYAENERIRYWSVGTLKGVYDHEEGHQMEFLVKGRRDSVLKSLYNQYISPRSREITKDGLVAYTSKMARGLSEYANENIGEFIAEGWAEYRSSSSPRPLAKAIGDRMMELYSGRKK